jgi:hypothetical protein
MATPLENRDVADLDWDQLAEEIRATRETPGRVP